jgi:hypothetical protein
VAPEIQELTLHSTIESFESEPLGTVPRGWEDVESAWVAELDGARALEIADASTSVLARASLSAEPASTRSLEFRVRPITLPNALLFDVDGTDATGADAAVYHLSIEEDGRIRRYDAPTATWTDVADPGTVDVTTDTTIRLVAGLGSATLCVNEVAVAQVAPSLPDPMALGGTTFASAGTATVGDDVRIDDVWLADTVTDCTIERPPEVAEPGDDTAAPGRARREPAPCVCGGRPVLLPLLLALSRRRVTPAAVPAAGP